MVVINHDYAYTVHEVHHMAHGLWEEKVLYLNSWLIHQLLSPLLVDPFYQGVNLHVQLWMYYLNRLISNSGLFSQILFRHLSITAT